MHKNYAYFFAGLMDEIPTFVVDPLAFKDPVWPYAIVNNNNTSFYLQVFRKLQLTGSSEFSENLKM